MPAMEPPLSPRLSQQREQWQEYSNRTAITPKNNAPCGKTHSDTQQKQDASGALAQPSESSFTHQNPARGIETCHISLLVDAGKSCFTHQNPARGIETLLLFGGGVKVNCFTHQNPARGIETGVF